MRRILQLIALAIGLTLVAAPSTARTYDCSKPGNANKTVCKTAAAAAPAAAVKPAPAARHYDCSKAGNANKAVCKSATVPPTPAPASPPAATAPRMTRAAPARPMASAPANATGPDGATAQCRDGSYSHSAHRSGTCSHHGGVKTWY